MQTSPRPMGLRLLSDLNITGIHLSPWNDGDSTPITPRPPPSHCMSQQQLRVLASDLLGCFHGCPDNPCLPRVPVTLALS